MAAEAEHGLQGEHDRDRKTAAKPRAGSLDTHGFPLPQNETPGRSRVFRIAYLALPWAATAAAARAAASGSPRQRHETTWSSSPRSDCSGMPVGMRGWRVA